MDVKGWMVATKPIKVETKKPVRGSKGIKKGGIKGGDNVWGSVGSYPA